jgi:hypothetical protein
LYRVYSVTIVNIMTCRPIARERVGKHVSMEMDFWEPTRYDEDVSMNTNMLCNRRPDQKGVQS